MSFPMSYTTSRLFIITFLLSLSLPFSAFADEESSDEDMNEEFADEEFSEQEDEHNLKVGAGRAMSQQQALEKFKKEALLTEDINFIGVDQHGQQVTAGSYMNVYQGINKRPVKGDEFYEII